MKRLVAIFVFISVFGFSQTSTIYPNFDFGLGNLNNWTFSTSTRATLTHSLTSVPVNCTPPPSSTSACSGRASIIDTSFFKANNNCFITTASPVPYKNMMYLTSNSSPNVTLASYQFTVNASAPVLNLQYVHQLTGSETGLDQPFTQFMIKDLSSSVIPGTFVDFSILTHSSLATYNSAQACYCLGWSTYTQNLSSYIGQTLVIEIRTATCGYNGHQNRSYLNGYFSTVTGVKETDLPKSIQIVPNPANDFITIKKPFDEDLRVLIYDSQGRVVKEEFSEKIDISDLQKGFYFVRALGKQNNYSQTFIKE